MKYIIGIDLGTTHCSLTYSYIEESGLWKSAKLLIPQLDQKSGLIEEELLPSFLYAPLESEKIEGALPWKSESRWIVGSFAKGRGTEVPNRLISSSKSWLSSLGMDLKQPLLPEIDGDLAKISPFEATYELLEHLKSAWNSKFPEDAFVEQKILVTVPASFDPAAREITLEAAKQAGFKEVTLLEEPQAAFYSWLNSHEQWREELSVGSTVLVVDIGGGTTDFSLISLREVDGQLELKREAVGSHLLLGGDNVDWAVAYLAKEKLESQGVYLDEWQQRVLVNKARKIKEEFFNGCSESEFSVTIAGRSSKLIGGTLSCSLNFEEVQQTVLEGFFPLVAATDQAQSTRRSGLQTEGLPFAEDPRVTAQLAKFLSMTGEDKAPSVEDFVIPTHVLFNGGSTKSELFRGRVLKQLSLWAEDLSKDAPIEIVNSGYDTAVSSGASYYGVICEQGGMRIKSGTASSYYIGVQKAAPAIPGVKPRFEAVCIAPYGMEEGSELTLKSRQFSLILGQEVSFRFFAHSTPKLTTGKEPATGDSVHNWESELRELNPIETLLEAEEGQGTLVSVSLRTKLTELGVLEIYCDTKEGKSFKLQFDVRSTEVEQVAAF